MWFGGEAKDELAGGAVLRELFQRAVGREKRCSECGWRRWLETDDNTKQFGITTFDQCFKRSLLYATTRECSLFCEALSCVGTQRSVERRRGGLTELSFAPSPLSSASSFPPSIYFPSTYASCGLISSALQILASRC